MNALTALLRRPLAYCGLRHELLLLLSFVSANKNGELTVHSDDLRSSARHIDAFFSEAVGLGMLTAAVREVYDWRANHKSSLANFDVLPPEVIGDYLNRGVRPDLLFQFSADKSARLAGEARGRSAKRPRKQTGSRAQRDRLNQILGWSQRHEHHPVTMAWTYTAPEQVQVDLFTMTLPQAVRPRPEQPAPPVVPPPARPPHGHSTAGLPTEPRLPTSRSDSGGPDQDFAGQDPMDRPDAWRPEWEDLFDSAQGFVPENASGPIDYLYLTAPEVSEAPQPWGVALRGEWARANLFGRHTAQLFLGVLPDEPELGLLTAINSSNQRSAQRLEDDPVHIDIVGSPSGDCVT
jgi:hypothetical protein